MIHVERRKFLVASCAIGTAIPLSSCSTGDSGVDPDGSVTLTFWHSADGATATALTDLVDDFNAANPGIVIQATYQGKYDDTVSKLSASVQSGELPDLVQINDVNTAFMIDSGLALPAQELLEEAGIDYDFDALVPAVSGYYTVDGAVSSMPFQVSQPAVFVRDDVLSATGTSVDTFPSTTAELFDWVRDAKDATGKAGLSFHLNPWWFEQLTAGAGIEYCTPGNGREAGPAATFVVSENAQVEQWTELQSLFDEGAALNVGTDFPAAVNALASGEAGAIFASSGAAGTVDEAMTEDWSIVPFPIDDPEQGGVVPGGNSVFAIAESLDSEAALRAAGTFLAYLGSDDVQGRLFDATGYLPTTTVALDASEEGADPRQRALLEQLRNTPQTTASAGCLSGALQSVRGELGPGIEKIVQGADVEDTLSGVEEGSEGLVSDYNERAGL